MYMVQYYCPINDGWVEGMTCDNNKYGEAVAEFLRLSNQGFQCRILSGEWSVIDNPKR